VVVTVALDAAPILAACDPALMYQTIKVAVIQRPPATAAEFDRLMSTLGPVQQEHVWKCESEAGSCLAVFIPAKRWIHLDYTPPKAERVPDALLSILAAKAHAEPVGPRWIRFEYRSDEDTIAALGSSVEIDETITVSLTGAIHEDTQCTIKLGVQQPAKK
jgi:hypothetical protein